METVFLHSNELNMFTNNKTAMLFRWLTTANRLTLLYNIFATVDMKEALTRGQ